ncbi:hypothetical protein DFJ63DRAFT_206126 [Scheffersomyces coipomensis]|uniref:uncharacterized protein n=1 Tax=Scheffersomyces coipomensis TaxID=1788519 RepID=UPI00315CE051
MYSRTRKPIESSFNGNIQDENLAPSNNNTTTGNLIPNTSSTITSTTTTTTTIPPNKGGKRYTMNEVFQVWYDNKEEILNPKFELPVQHNENYKLSKPTQIYHLDLQPEGSTGVEPEPQPEKEQLSVDQKSSLDQFQGQDQGQLTSSLDQLGINDLSSSESPAIANPIVPNSFVDNNTLGSNIIQNGPPGMNQGPPPPPPQQIPPSLTPPLITSDKIEWYYIDPHGTEQGPFNGDLMQEWLSGGYLHLDLQIRRKEETTYRTVKQLCDSVQNYVQPFKVPLIDLNAPPPPPPQPSLIQPPFSHLPKQQSQFQQFLSGNSRLNNPQSSLFGNDFINNDPFANPLSQSTFQNPTTTSNQFGIDTLNQHHHLHNHHQTFANPLQSILQQQVQQPSLSRNNSGWGSTGLDTTGGFGNSNPSTPVSTTLPQINQPTPLSPWLSGIPSSSRTNSPFVPSSTNNVEVVDDQKNHRVTDDHVLNEIHTSVVTDILNDEDHHFGKEKATTTTTAAAAPVVSEKKVNASAPVVEKSVKGDEPRYELKGAPIKKESSEGAPTKSVVKSAVAASSTTVEPTPAPKQELAPWAVKPEQAKPSLTLKEIQNLEAERSEKQKAQLRLEQQQQQQVQQVQQSKAWASIDEPVIVEKAPALPKTSSWASNSAINSPVVSKKTLADIQREEAEAAAAAKLAGRSSAATKNSFANVIANPTAVPREDLGAWTTVASKRAAVKKPQPVAQVITNSSAASKTNPQLLRSVSATKTVVSSVNDTALREEFLIWARSQMTNLYPTVSKDDLLDIFVTLPATSSDSSQLISETIYSSSATMDGRRFAQEFLKRRQRVDQQVSNQDEEAWSASIISSANKVSTVDEDGWSTSVKSKKKNTKKF